MSIDAIKLSNNETFIISNNGVQHTPNHVIKPLYGYDTNISIHIETGIINDAKWTLIPDLSQFIKIYYQFLPQRNYSCIRNIRVGTKLIVLSMGQRYIIIDNALMFSDYVSFAKVYYTDSITYYAENGQTILANISNITNVINSYNYIKDGYLQYIYANDSITSANNPVFIQQNRLEYVMPQLYKNLDTDEFYIFDKYYCRYKLPNITNCKVSSMVTFLQTTDNTLIIGKYSYQMIYDYDSKIDTIYAVQTCNNNYDVLLYATNINNENILITYNIKAKTISSIPFTPLITTNFGTVDIINRTYTHGLDVIADIRICKCYIDNKYMKIYLYGPTLQYTKNARC